MTNKQLIEMYGAGTNHIIAEATSGIHSVTPGRTNYMIQITVYKSRYFGNVCVKTVDAYGTKKEVENSNEFPTSIDMVRLFNIAFFSFTYKADYEHALNQLWQAGFENASEDDDE